MTERDGAHALLEEALASEHRALSEYESKRLLRAYDVPVVDEALCADAAAAVAAAERIGFPVAVKACGRALQHKTDRGLVHLNLRDADSVGDAVARMQAALGDEAIDGFLVQRMARGGREVIVGGLRDPIFGPCVMFGMGGIAVEAFGDVAFRLAPLDDRDALEMLGEVRGAKLLGPFRGEPAADTTALAGVLRRVGALIVEHPEIAQVDINPLIIEDGLPVAVDALVTLAPETPPPSAPIEIPDRMRRFHALFEPESVAIIGATDTPGKWGFRILYNTLEGDYRGRLYGVHPRHREILGVPCFPSIEALPETPDVAVVVVPPPGVLDCVQQCAARGVPTVIVITAGFGEVDDAETRAAEQALARLAEETGVLVIGPNCAGVVSTTPHRLYCGMIARYPDPGGLSIVSQSGNVGSTVLSWAALHQVGIGRFISTGNEAATRTEDYLAFFAEDEKTASLISYIEGTRDGRRLQEALRRTAARKPVIVVKGGRSDAGLKAAQSHTGSLASEVKLFRAMCRQAGAAIVDDIYEAMEVAGIFLHQPLPKGRRVVIVSQGGGWGVIAADACAEAGLDVMPLPESVMRELDDILPSWWSRNNPIDLVASNDLSALSRTVEAVIKHPDVDAVLLLGVGYIASALSRYALSKRAREHGLDKMTEFGANIEVEEARRIAGFIETYRKPLLIASDSVLLAYGEIPNVVIREFERLGCYIFSSPAHVARALAHMAARREFLEGTPRTRP
ncbi:MAG TPA: acetate--CoA ligase family protein [Candidatus Hydrogenedentes bacterium]|nr:acetate--CoA ligase family protein [Candidatus Hydrogenedentota bacterium]